MKSPSPKTLVCGVAIALVWVSTYGVALKDSSSHATAVIVTGLSFAAYFIGLINAEEP